MVVIEERCGILAVRIVTEFRLPRYDPSFRIAITVGRDFASVQMDDVTYIGISRLRAMQRVIDGEQMFRGQLVGPLDGDGFIGPGFNDRPGTNSAVSSKSCGWKVAMDLRLKFPHGDAIVSTPFFRHRYCRDGQPVNEFGQSMRTERNAGQLEEKLPPAAHVLAGATTS